MKVIDKNVKYIYGTDVCKRGFVGEFKSSCEKSLDVSYFLLFLFSL